MKILIVCAPQTFGCNLGMLSVDLAAFSFFDNCFPDAELSFVSLYQHKLVHPELPYICTSLADYSSVEELFSDKDLIFYWGDFLNAWQYREDIINILFQKKLYNSREQAKEAVRKFLYLSGMPDEYYSKAVLYGGTILFNTIEAYSDKSYLEDMDNLLNKARYVLFREAFSAQMAGYITGAYERCAQATDAAFLLELDKLKGYCSPVSTVQKVRKKKKIGLFIGRDNFDIGLASGFIEELRSELDAELEWINWGEKPFFLDKTKSFSESLPELKFNKKDNLNTLERLVSLSQEYDYIVTDTYHVCVNGWNLETPVVCLVDNLSSSLSVNSGDDISKRDKRVVLFWGYGADAFIVNSSDLIGAGALTKKAKDIASLLKNESVSDWVIRLIKDHSSKSKSLLGNIVNQISGK